MKLLQGSKQGCATEEEYAGTVSLIKIDGLVSPIIVRMSSENATTGDACAYFDTVNWAAWLCLEIS